MTTTIDGPSRPRGLPRPGGRPDRRDVLEAHTVTEILDTRTTPPAELGEEMLVALTEARVLALGRFVAASWRR